MPFQDRNFSKPIYEETGKEPKKVVIISCEGCNTEPEYFSSIVDKLSENVKNLVEIEIVEKLDNSSDPNNVLRNLENHIEEKFDFKNGTDILWLVIDRESVDSRKKAIEDILPVCHTKGYSIALSNPLFEFWLLLHVCDISKYKKEDLHNNEWVTEARNRRFIDKQLSEILDNGFNKKSGRFNQEIISVENIKRAIAQEQQFCSTLPNLLDELGTNVSILINDILDLE
ncbi:hypothetical protein LCGC14_0317340 [marine sediment metagenome]|uniref:RloB domain-containing protein n=1 Tax=marine sediment metagenome TaxID=412755 RepID=A0A0F9WS86_9ZZZZ|nr:RloB family protein [Halomonas sp.]HDZ46554.1 RloB domain-containing protein [Halomonas sp.]